MPQLVSPGGRRVWDRPRDFGFRCHLPYGRWLCADGREVLFNRFYEPIWQVVGDTPASEADPEEWVRWERQEWFYGDVNPPWRSRATLARCLEVLALRGAGWGPIAHYADVRRAAGRE